MIPVEAELAVKRVMLKYAEQEWHDLLRWMWWYLPCLVAMIGVCVWAAWTMVLRYQEQGHDVSLFIAAMNITSMLYCLRTLGGYARLLGGWQRTLRDLRRAVAELEQALEQGWPQQ